MLLNLCAKIEFDYLKMSIIELINMNKIACNLYKTAHGEYSITWYTNQVLRIYKII